MIDYERLASLAERYAVDHSTLHRWYTRGIKRKNGDGVIRLSCIRRPGVILTSIANVDRFLAEVEADRGEKLNQQADTPGEPTVKKEFTQRGFPIIKFTDLYGAKCSIQKSSLATEEAIWLGVDSAEPKILASKVGAVNPETGEVSGWIPYQIPDDVLLNTRMHLTRDQVKKLLPILSRFAEDGQLEQSPDAIDV